MKVYETAVRIPWPNRALHCFIIHRPIAPKPLRQPITGAYIISGKDIYFAETPEQCILCGPSADAAQAHQQSKHPIIIELSQILSFQMPRFGHLREFQQRTSFSKAEPKVAQGIRTQAENVRWLWEPMMHGTLI